MSPDLIFSYWIIIWYLLYCFRIVFINPKFSIICGLIVNLIILLIMIIYKTNIRIIFSFFVLFFISKLMPIFTIWNTKIKMNDVYATFFLFFIYFIWTLINKKKLIFFTKQVRDLIIYNKNVYPGMKIVALSR